MSSFKKFLQETPYIGGLKFLCPDPNHPGDKTIDGSGDGALDTLAELYPTHLKKVVEDALATPPREPVLPFPLLCKKDMSIFMYNRNTNLAYAPVKPEEIRFCEMFLANIPKKLDHNFNPGDESWKKLHILKPS